MSRCTGPSESICDLWSTRECTNALVSPSDWPLHHRSIQSCRSFVKTVRCQAACLLRRLADPCRYSRWGPDEACPDDHQSDPLSRQDHQLREVWPNTQPGLPVHRDAVQRSTVHSGTPAEDASSPFTNTGWPTPSLQPTICTGCWAWWCSGRHWSHGEDFASIQSSGGPPQLRARGPGVGKTGFKFLSGFCQKWPGGEPTKVKCNYIWANVITFVQM